MQNKDHRYINAPQNMYANHGYEYSTGGQHIPNEQYGNSSYPVSHNPNSNPYGNSNMRGAPYEDNHRPVHGHYIPPQDNAYINRGPDVSGDRKNSSGNMNFDNSYNMPPEHGPCHSHTPMVNMSPDNVHSPMPAGVGMVQPSHQPPGVNMVQPPHQPNRQGQFPGKTPNSWNQYQELHPRVQPIHHPSQQPHFHTVSPNHVQQFSHETHASNTSNVFAPCNSAMTNSFQYQPVHNVNERRNVSNPLQSLQNMVMSDGNVQQTCPPTAVPNQCSIEYDKPASPYINSDGYQKCYTPDNKNMNEQNMYMLPTPSNNNMAIPVATPISKEQNLSNINSQNTQHCIDTHSPDENMQCSTQTNKPENSETCLSPQIHSNELPNQSSENAASVSDENNLGNDANSPNNFISDDKNMNLVKSDLSVNNAASEANSEAILNNDMAVKQTVSSEENIDSQSKTESSIMEQAEKDPVTTNDKCNDESLSNTQNTVQSTVDQNGFDKTVTIDKLDNENIKVEESCKEEPSKPGEENFLVKETKMEPTSESPYCEESEVTIDSRESDNIICSGVTTDTVDTEVLSVSAKSLHKTVRAIKLRNLKRLRKSPQSSRKSFITMAEPRNCESDATKNPVRVVIHRIRANSENDMWHIPSNDSKVIKKENNIINGSNIKTVPEQISKGGPQIIILSPALSRKKTSVRSSKSKPVVKSENDAPVETAGQDIGAATLSNEQKELREGGAEHVQVSPIKKAPNRPVRRQGRATKLSASKIKRKRVLKGKKKFQKVVEETKVLQKVKKAKKSFSGPYVRMIDSHNITVVNVALKGDEKDKKPTQAKNAAESSFSKKSQVGHTSTLSPNYDAFNVDRTWTCIFCHKGSHTLGLGDLFGPYYVNETSVLSESTPVRSHKENRPRSGSKKGIGKRKRTDVHSILDSKKPIKKTKDNASTAESQLDVSPSVMDLEKDMSSMVMSEEDESRVKKEIWIHEDCSVWCQTVSIVGQQVYGLEEAVQESRECICSVCKLNGATMGCWHKGCSEQYHFACAVQKGCQIDIENFSLFCSQHKKEKAAEKAKS